MHLLQWLKNANTIGTPARENRFAKATSLTVPLTKIAELEHRVESMQEKFAREIRKEISYSFSDLFARKNLRKFFLCCFSYLDSSCTPMLREFHAWL